VRTTIFTAAAAGVMTLALLAGCHSGSSAGSTSSHARAVASSTAVRADEQAAVKLVQSCLTATHIATFKSCVEGKVPPAKRAALKQCLARDVAAIPGLHAAAAKKALKDGAQACVATALKP
jgi:hypothetical protein